MAKRKPKLRKSGQRDFFSKEHQAWAKAVKKRDGCCQWPECSKSKGLQAHHIKTFWKHPELRTVVSNGILLCAIHHRKIWGKEDQYIAMFSQIVSNKSSLANDLKKEIFLQLKDKDVAPDI